MVSKKRTWRSSVTRSEVVARISSIFDHLENDFMRSILTHGKVFGRELTTILEAGWYPVNNQIAWSRNDRSIINVQLGDWSEVFSQDVVHLVISGNYAKTVEPLTELYCEGEHLGNYDLSNAKIMIPVEIDDRTSISIMLVHPKSVVPAEVEINDDRRLIAYALRSFDIGVSRFREQKDRESKGINIP
ncbi:MAG: hypothetical protein ACI9CO_001209 [Candidatus Azotimanducaceae bacterium]